MSMKAKNIIIMALARHIAKSHQGQDLQPPHLECHGVLTRAKSCFSRAEEHPATVEAQKQAG